MVVATQRVVELQLAEVKAAAEPVEPSVAAEQLTEVVVRVRRHLVDQRPT